MLSVLAIFVTIFINASDITLTPTQIELVQKAPEYMQEDFARRTDQQIWKNLFLKRHFLAALKGDLREFKSIVSTKKINIRKERFPDGSNLLHFAACSSNSTLVEYLLEKKVKIDKENAQGYVPLFFAFLNRELKNIEVLLKHGANPLARTTVYVVRNNKRYICSNGKFSTEWSPFKDAHAAGWASSLGFNDALKRLYEAGIPLVQPSYDIFKRTIINGDLKTTYQLLHYRAEPQERMRIHNDNEHFTYSIFVIESLVEHLFGCKFSPILPVVLYGILKSPTNNPLIYACPRVFWERGEDAPVIELYLSAPLHQPDLLGALPVHYAIGQGNVAVVKQLIEKGSNVYKRTIYGQRALDIVRVILKRDTYQTNTKKEDYLALKELLTKAELVKEAALLRSKKKHDKKYTYVEAPPLPQEIVKHIKSYVEEYSHA